MIPSRYGQRRRKVAAFFVFSRIDCMAVGPNNEERLSATLLIPGNQAGHILQSLTQALQELEKRLREQAQHQPASAGRLPS
jgi:hypothetical protein